jgi:transketolase
MTTSFVPEQDVTRSLHELAQQLRVDSVRCSAAASSGHPTSSLSAADLMAVLLARHLRYDFSAPDAPGNDHLIFSKGHASPLYYAMLRAADAIGERELLTYRQIRSRLEGYPTPRLPWVDVATGSLGQGLPIGAGVAMAGKYLDRLPYRVWVLCGDSELAEGSIWEAAEQAAACQLDNLTVIVDVNRLGQRGPTRHGWDTAAYAARFRAFGWHTEEIDGHDIEESDRALSAAVAHRGEPTVILARTRKGRGVAGVENREHAHGKPVPDPDAAVRELGGIRDIRVRVAPPVPVPPAQQARIAGHGPGAPASVTPHRVAPPRLGEPGVTQLPVARLPVAQPPVAQPAGPPPRVAEFPVTRERVLRAVSAGPGAHRPTTAWRPPAYRPGSLVSTRTGFGQALAALGDIRPELVVLDGEVSDSTRTSFFAEAHPDRFFECYAAEQQMLATAIGMQVRGWVPFAATFAAFFSRAYDFIRMAAVSRADIRLVGSHSGVSVGEDGPSQMALEDIAALRAVHGSTVLCPSDANQAAWLTGVLADLPGVSYLRTCRGDTPVIYQPGDRFEVGGSRVLRSSPDDEVTLVAAGITVHEALAAADLLAEDGISARVIDAYSVKPIDAATLRVAARETGRIVTAEDHWPEGGLGDAVLSALAAQSAQAGGGAPLPVVRKLAVRAMPGSATPDEQVQLAGIDMASIATAAAELVGADLA